MNINISCHYLIISPNTVNRQILPLAALLLEPGEISMLRSCKYCGRVHDEQYICPQKSSRIKVKNYRHDTTADKFRRTMTWTNMSRRVRDRDHYMCLCCAAGICKDDGTLKTIEIENISVH